MDEPLSALEALLREDMQETQHTLWKETRYTQLLVTHSIEEAVYLGQRIVVMAPRPGRIVAHLSNPCMGSAAYRNTNEFFAQCKAVRAALERGCADSDVAHGGAPIEGTGKSENARKEESHAE